MTTTHRLQLCLWGLPPRLYTCCIVWLAKLRSDNITRSLFLFYTRDSSLCSRYKRVFSVGTHGITTYNPTTLEVTNQVSEHTHEASDSSSVLCVRRWLSGAAGTCCLWSHATVENPFGARRTAAQSSNQVFLTPRAALFECVLSLQL